MIFLDYISQHKGFPKELTREERAYELRKQLAYCYENRWLKDNNLINRHKKSRPPKDMLGSCYEKSVWSMVRPVIQKALFDSGPCILSLRKTGPTRCSVKLTESRSLSPTEDAAGQSSSLNLSIARIWDRMYTSISQAIQMPFDPSFESRSGLTDPSDVRFVQAMRALRTSLDSSAIRAIKEDLTLHLSIDYSSLSLFASYESQTLLAFYEKLVELREAFLGVMTRAQRDLCDSSEASFASPE